MCHSNVLCTLNCQWYICSIYDWHFLVHFLRISYVQKDVLHDIAHVRVHVITSTLNVHILNIYYRPVCVHVLTDIKCDSCKSP